eukprot:scaffold55314_cov35-Tisochrysis_lutea.AAC.1
MPTSAAPTASGSFVATELPQRIEVRDAEPSSSERAQLAAIGVVACRGARTSCMPAPGSAGVFAGPAGASSPASACSIGSPSNAQ